MGLSPAQTASLATAQEDDTRPEPIFNCKIQNLVCLMQCQICGMQCVKETGNALHTRMSSQHSDIRTKMLNKHVTALFNQPGFSIEDLEVMGTEKHTRTITCPAENNRKATGPLN